MRNFIARTVGYRIQVRNVHEIRRLRFFLLLIYACFITKLLFAFDVSPEGRV